MRRRGGHDIQRIGNVAGGARVFQAALIYLLLTLVGCDRAERSEKSTSDRQTEARTRRVFVVNYPLEYFAERIGGDGIEVVLPASGEEDPAFWKPDAATINLMQRADLILLNGAGYAKWTNFATLPRSIVVNTSASFQDRYIRIEQEVTHAHGPDGEHAHAGTAFTTWLDPRLALEQAEAIRDRLVRLLPEQVGMMKRNFDDLRNDMLELDARLERITEEHQGKPLLASHPVYQYFARRYGLNLLSVHWEPHETPDENGWSRFDELIADHVAKVMLWEALPNAAIRDALDRRGVGVVVFDPCGNVPDEGDYLSVMRRNASRLDRALN